MASQLNLDFDLPRSTRLFCLAPAGEGSERESFVSWLTRLARAHRIPVRVLLLEILPGSEIKAAPDGRRRLRSNIFADLGRIIPSLEEASGRTDLDSLDLSRFYQGIAKIGFLRKKRAWCPRCLSENSYERLSWKVKLVESCSRHSCRLLVRCLKCEKELPPLSLGSCLDYCPFCSTWLALSPRDPATPSLWECHMTDEIGILLSKARSGTRYNTPAEIGLGLRNLLPEWSQKEICDLLGLNDNCFALLKKRNKTVSLFLLGKISFTLGIPMLDLLHSPPSTWTIRCRRKGFWVAKGRSLLCSNKAFLKPILKALAAKDGATLRSVSIALGHSRKAISENFPEEAEQILKRSSHPRYFGVRKQLK